MWCFSKEVNLPQHNMDLYLSSSYCDIVIAEFMNPSDILPILSNLFHFDISPNWMVHLASVGIFTNATVFTQPIFSKIQCGGGIWDAVS